MISIATQSFSLTDESLRGDSCDHTLTVAWTTLHWVAEALINLGIVWCERSTISRTALLYWPSSLPSSYFQNSWAHCLYNRTCYTLILTKHNVFTSISVECVTDNCLHVTEESDPPPPLQLIEGIITNTGLVYIVHGFGQGTQMAATAYSIQHLA